MLLTNMWFMESSLTDAAIIAFEVSFGQTLLVELLFAWFVIILLIVCKPHEYSQSSALCKSNVSECLIYVRDSKFLNLPKVGQWLFHALP